MNKPAQSTPPVGIDADTLPDRPASTDEGRKPEEPPGKLEKTPEGAVGGRDRLSENEDKRMHPGVPDSAHS